MVEGEAQIRKASIHCTYLKEPMTNVYADVSLANDQLQVSDPLLVAVQLINLPAV